MALHCQKLEIARIKELMELDLRPLQEANHTQTSVFFGRPVFLYAL